MKKIRVVAIIVQTFLFVMPILMAYSFFFTSLSQNEHYIKSFDYGDINVLECDDIELCNEFKEEYNMKEWSVKNKKKFIVNGLMPGIIIGVFLQVFWLLWFLDKLE